MVITDSNPGMLRLRTGTAVLDRGHGEVQLGTDPRWALRLSGLDTAEVAWVRELARRRHTTPRAAAARIGVRPERRDEILALLLAGGFLHPTTSESRPAPVLATGGGAADAPGLGAVRPDGAGRATLARRARAAVAVSGLGRIGAATALHLATAGVGTLILDDAAPVQTADPGLGAYVPADVGRPRRDALTDVLARSAPGVRATSDGVPDVVVLVETQVAAPARYLRLMSEGVPHLPLTVREADVVVGPFVLPGRTACARCAELRHADDDPAWPALAAQLRELPEAVQETSLAAVTAALAAAQVLTHLDGLRPVAADAVIEVALPQSVPHVVTLPPHPRCGCAGLGHPCQTTARPGRA